MLASPRNQVPRLLRIPSSARSWSLVRVSADCTARPGPSVMASLLSNGGDDGQMTLRTAFTGLFGLRHPIALAPMGGASGGELAAAVCEGGGLGIVGAGRGDAT